MAARVNTKLIAIVALAAVIAAGVIGAFALLQFRGDATRNVRQGDELMAAGQYAAALGAYGRALSKDSSNLAYVDKSLDALARIVPKTRDELRQRFDLYQSLLEKRVGIAPMRPELHMPLIELRLVIAQLDPASPSSWSSLEEVARRMAEGVDPNDPAHATATMFRAIGTLGRRETAEPAQVERALADLREAVARDPGDDLAQSSLVASLLSDARRRQLAGRVDPGAVAAMDEARTALREAVRRAPRGPLVAAVELQDLLFRRFHGDTSVTDATLDAVADRLLTNLQGERRAWIYDRALVPLVAMGDRERAARAAEMIRAYVSAHPEELAVRQALMAMLIAAQDIDGARQAAAEVLALGPQPVGLQAIIQPELRVAAAATLFDAEFARFRTVPPEDRTEARAAVAAALEGLAAELENPESDPRYIQSQARLAFAAGRPAEALSRYEEFLRRFGEASGQANVYFEAAHAAAETNQLGIARRRIGQAAALSPRSLEVLVLKADLERRDGDEEAARASITRAAQIAPDDPRVVELRSVLSASFDEEVVRQLAVAQSRFERGDLAGARQQLENALQQRPDDPRYVRSLAYIELILGNTERAGELARRGLELAPGNEFFRRAEILAATTDPAERILRTVEIETAPGPDRDARSFRAISRALIEQRIVAQRLRESGDEASAAVTDESIARLASETARLRALIEPLRATDPVVVIAEFDLALSERDFARAQAMVDAQSRPAGRVVSGPELASMRARLLLTQVDAEPTANVAARRARLVEAADALSDALLRAPESTDLLLLLGRIRGRLGNAAGAVDSFETAYAQRPNDMILVEGFVEALQSAGEQTRALTVLREAARRRDFTPNLRTRWLLMEAIYGDKLRALTERRSLYSTAPDDFGNAIQFAALLMMLPPSRELIVDASGRARHPDDRWRAMPIAQQRQLLDAQRREWLDEAERILAQVAARHPKSFEVAALRAEHAKLRGDAAAGETILRGLVAGAGDDVTTEMLMALGGYLVGVGRPVDAKPFLDEAVRRQSPAREADRALARLALQQGDAATAIAHLRAVAEATGDPRDRLAVVEGLARGGDIEVAERELAAVEASVGSDGEVALMRAALASQRLDIAVRTGAGIPEAIQQVRAALEQARELRPADPAPLVGQAQLIVTQWQMRPDRQPSDPRLDEASQLLDQALELRADYWPASKLRSQLLGTRGDFTRARLEAERFLRISPLADDARQQLIDLWVQARSFDRAIAVAREGADLRPADARWHRVVGDLQDRAGDVVGATASHRRAMELEPGVSPDRLVMLMLKQAPTRPPEYAGVVQLLSQRSAALERSPYLRAAYGAALANVGRRNEGLEQLRQSWRQYEELLGDRPDLINGWFDQLWLVFPGDRTSDAEIFVRELAGEGIQPFALRELARRYAQQGQPGMARALEFYQVAASRAQTAPPQLQSLIHFDLGTLQYQMGSCDGAVRSLETAAGLAPDNPAILNNLAYAYIDCLKDPARALPHAQRAVAIAPGEASFIDTLGLALERLGRIAEAEQQYRAALAATRLAETHVHLARVLAGQNRATEARAELRRALEVDPRFRENAEYRAVEALVGR
ncbi:MAG TPA: tetratricopeptide repeat protein [Phycisphaerales bacterium]|nr:tetratricopeptide repeat protein [Phycisphaerales bacterium]HMP38281.1 tetratricopeptide repeat protein [Phycisphaerales bacterium]